MAIGTVAEFFAGIGLVRLAAENAGWKTIFGNDIDRKKKAMYIANFGATEFVLADINTISSLDIPDVDLVTASFPCTDLSLAGHRYGLQGRHSSTYWEFYRVLCEMKERRPRFVLLENVVGLLSSQSGSDLRDIVASLVNLDYACDLLQVDAIHFVPQSRARLFIVGVQGVNGRSFREFELHSARPRGVVEFVRRNRDLRWSPTEIPALPGIQRNLSAYIEPLPAEASEWWSSERRQGLWLQMSPKHQRLLEWLRDGDHSRFATVFRRARKPGCRAELRVDGVAGCLRPPRGGSSKQYIVEAQRGDWRVRHMTAREYARLQGAPDYRITVPYLQALFGFGDAVCVPVVEWVINNVINPLADGRPAVAPPCALSSASSPSVEPERLHSCIATR
jgi:DNA (cytosine-5)-methyltransferase 1